MARVNRGFYGYVDYTTDTGKPFYVGKGSGRRASVRGRNLKHTRVAEKHGRKRVVEFVCSVESVVFEWEAATIAELGTFGSCLGCNLTMGGEGPVGRLVAPETRAKLAAASMGRVFAHTPESRAKISGALRGLRRSLETRQKMSAVKLGKTHTAETRERLRQLASTPEAIARTRATHLQRPRSEETLRKMSEAAKGRTPTPEARAKMRAAKIGKLKSPETRARMSAAQQKRRSEERGLR